MIRVERSVLVTSATDRAFEYCASGDNNTRFELEVKEFARLTDPPAGIGARYRVRRRMFGMPVSSIAEVTEYSPPTAYTLSSAFMGMPLIGRMTFADAPNGTLVELVLSLDAHGLRRPIGAMAAPVLGWQMSKNLRALGEQLSDG